MSSYLHILYELRSVQPNHRKCSIISGNIDYKTEIDEYLFNLPPLAQMYKYLCWRDSLWCLFDVCNTRLYCNTRHMLLRIRRTTIEPGMVDLAQKWVRLAPNGTNPGLFQIRFQYIWLDRPNLPSL